VGSVSNLSVAYQNLLDGRWGWLSSLLRKTGGALFTIGWRIDCNIDLKIGSNVSGMKY
jgi:hypothetical protein